MIGSIVKGKIPLPARPRNRSGSTTTESQSPAKPITASESSPKPSPRSLPRTTVVRGFSPSQIPVPRTISGAAQSSDALPEPKSSPMSNEQDQNLTDRKPIISIIKKPVFQIGGSSEEDGSLTSAVASSRPSWPLSAREDQASFSNHIMTRTIDDEAAVDSDTDDYIDESAIDDDDDSSDWEDSMEESGKSSMDEKFFQRYRFSIDVGINFFPHAFLGSHVQARFDLGDRKHIGPTTSGRLMRIRCAENPMLAFAEVCRFLYRKKFDAPGHIGEDSEVVPKR
ncbi:Protein of unknown function DUF3295 [Fusarium oxysporum f. sp. vasinfectum]|nr:Protein of unknown function DUF3295 [Fusarium oxysporum f. sp. vasinfectum]